MKRRIKALDHPQFFYAQKPNSKGYMIFWAMCLVILGFITYHFVTGFISSEKQPPTLVQAILYVLPALLLLPPGIKWTYEGLTQQQKPLVSVFREGLQLHCMVSQNKNVLYSYLFVLGVVLFKLNYSWGILVSIVAFYWFAFRNARRKTNILWEEISFISLDETDGLKIAVKKNKTSEKFVFSHPDSISRANTFDIPPENVMLALYFYLQNHSTLPSWKKEPTV